jgi:hypothetical protein
LAVALKEEKCEDLITVKDGRIEYKTKRGKNEY